ncbi:uncharacterized protein METZ01_LOCUS241287, partial [marine metagenome]
MKELTPQFVLILLTFNSLCYRFIDISLEGQTTRMKYLL